MHRLPLADELPYRFEPPRLNRLVVRATRPVRRRMLRGEHQVEQIDTRGVEHLKPLLDRGDGIVLASNHSDRADGLVLLDLADRVGRPVYSMAAHQLFAGDFGLRHWLFPRLGVFPIDREGSDLASVKTAVNILASGKNPLLVFPEGEVYHTADRLTPLREGVAFLAASAAKRLAEAGRTVWIVPIGLKYRFVEGNDPLRALTELMDRLEARFTWWNRHDMTLIERIYRYAEGMLALKELEYLGAARPGTLKERIGSLLAWILDGLEDRHFGRRRTDFAPARVKELRKQCLEKLATPTIAAMEARRLRSDLNDLFVAIQLYSYPGDYIRDCPTVERVAEILMKYEEDVLGVEYSPPRGARRACLILGEPIDVGARLKEARKLKAVVSSLTNELESRIQSLLDEIGPGRPFPGLDGGKMIDADRAGLDASVSVV